MKNKISILIGTIFAILFISLGFGVGKVYATTGCFTDTIGNWAESYICWMKDKGITTGTGPGIYSPNSFVTRAQMAVFMQKQADVPPTKGDIYINVGPGAWLVDDTDTTGYIRNYPGYSQLRSSTMGNHYFMLIPSLPSSLYNTEMYVKGVKLCYDAMHAATINEISLLHYSSGVVLSQVNDFNIRSDNICSTFLMSTPSEFWGGDQVTLRIKTKNTTSVDDYVIVTSATFLLSPSASPAILAPVTNRSIPADTETVP